MNKYWVAPVALVLGFIAIPTSIAYYEYNYIERDYIYSRGHYMPSGYICDGVLYRRDFGAIFDKYGNNVECKVINMTPVERYSNEN